MNDRGALRGGARTLEVAALAVVLVACGSTPPTLPSSPSGTIVASAAPASSVPAASLGPGAIVTVVGTGVEGFGGVGGMGRQAQLTEPIDLAFDSAGNLYIVERFRDRVLVLGTDGIVRLAAGSVSQDNTPISGFSGDGGPALQATLDGVGSVAVDTAGNVYIADSGNHRIRRIDPSGTISTIAGNGIQGFSGDGGPAVDASLQFPAGIVVDRDGSVLFSDTVGRRVRRIDPTGEISTVVGTGKRGAPTEGALAVESALGGSDEHVPAGLALDAQGQLHITDYFTYRIWRVDAEGRIRGVAGNGSFASSGDGGPALAAGIAGPLDVCFGPGEKLYIGTHTHADVGNHVRVVHPDGTIATVAGSGLLASAGDGGPALEASLAIPASVAVGPDGNLYIADTLGHRVRMVILGR